MEKVTEKVIYKVFGLSIISEIPLPELSRTSNKVDSIDIEIKIEDFSNRAFKLSEIRHDLVIHENLVIFQIPNLAMFSIQDGKQITVFPMTATNEDLIRLYILGTCMGVILLQRKIIPLHGSAIAINGKAYAIVGDSGAGKSTLASAFLNKGFKFLSDDVIAVSISQDKDIPLVVPAYPQQKLWQDALEKFGMNKEKYQTVYGREIKYCIPVSSQFFNDPLPLAGVFELIKTESEQIEIHKIEKLERFNTLFNHTYRNLFIQKLGLLDWHFQISTKIIDKVDIYQLYRPISEFSTSQLVALMLNIINKGD